MENSKIKVNIWQMCYTTLKDFLSNNKHNAKCIDKGYVILDKLDDLWEENVWNLLNWGCWNYDKEKEQYVKPESVHSPLTHCNSDIIINIEGSNVYKYAKHVGFGEASSLQDAIKNMIEGFCSFWPSSEVCRTGGRVRQENDKVFQEINGKWVEVTW